jgi:hypothetical protein
MRNKRRGKGKRNAKKSADVFTWFSIPIVQIGNNPEAIFRAGEFWFYLFVFAYDKASSSLRPYK